MSEPDSYPESYPTDYPHWEVRIWKDKYGNHHRVDGPAVEYINGDNYWWYHGKNIKVKSQQEFEKLLKLKAFW
jgi:hypothetical protein